VILKIVFKTRMSVISKGTVGLVVVVSVACLIAVSVGLVPVYLRSKHFNFTFKLSQNMIKHFC
jgi:hypothetical protein